MKISALHPFWKTPPNNTKYAQRISVKNFYYSPFYPPSSSCWDSAISVSNHCHLCHHHNCEVTGNRTAEWRKSSFWFKALELQNKSRFQHLWLMLPLLLINRLFHCEGSNCTHGLWLGGCWGSAKNATPLCVHKGR